MPCPNENVYKQLRAACPHGAEGDCRELCSFHEQGYGYSYIGDAAKALNDFAECHVNTIENRNVSLTSSNAATTTEKTRKHTSALSKPPSTREIRLSFGEAMLIVLCSGIIVIILGGLCRSGCKKRKEMLKKKHPNDVEANRMSVEIQMMDKDEPVRIRRMSVGPEDVSRVGCMGHLFPSYPKLKEPRKKGNEERRTPGEESVDIERNGKFLNKRSFMITLEILCNFLKQTQNK